MKELTGVYLDEALAIALGYERVDVPQGLVDLGIDNASGIWRGYDQRYRLDGLPLFHRDLNAMRVVEDELIKRGDDFINTYVVNLFHIVGEKGWPFEGIHATAEQKARAALKTLKGHDET